MSEIANMRADRLAEIAAREDSVKVSFLCADGIVEFLEEDLDCAFHAIMDICDDENAIDIRIDDVAVEIEEFTHVMQDGIAEMLTYTLPLPAGVSGPAEFLGQTISLISA